MAKVKFITKALILIVFTLILVLIINQFYVDKVLMKKKVYRQDLIYKDYIKDLDNKEIEYAFFGDSFAMNAINPKYIDNSFNFGTIGESYVETYYKLRRVTEKDNVKIKTIILQTSLHTLSSVKTEDGSGLLKEPYLFKDFMSYGEINKIRKGNLISIWIESNFPFIGNGGEFNILIKKSEQNFIYRGWLKEEGDFSKLDREGEAYNRYKELFKWTMRINPTSFEYFKKTLELAKKHDIEVIFINYPVTEDFDKIIAENKVNKNEPYNLLFSEADKILGDYKFLNYYNLFFEKPDYFYDSDHLNPLGAEVLSKKIFDDLNNENFSEIDFKKERITNEYKAAGNNSSTANMFYLLILILEVIILAFLILFGLLRDKKKSL